MAAFGGQRGERGSNENLNSDRGIDITGELTDTLTIGDPKLIILVKYIVNIHCLLFLKLFIHWINELFNIYFNIF